MRKLSFSLLVAVFLFIELFGGIPLGFYLILIPGIFVVHHILSNKKLQTLNDFQAVANLSDVTDPGSLLVEIDDQLVVLIHAAGHYYALDDVCTHDGGPLSEGPLDAEEGSIACPRHGAKFDIKTGAALTMPATKPTRSHEVKIDGEQILVRLCED